MSTHNVQNTWRLSVGLYVRNNRYGFTFPCFGAGSSFRSSRSFAASSPHLQQSFSQPLNRSGMFDVDESGEVEVIIQQFQSVPTAEPTLGGWRLWSARLRTRALDQPGETAGAVDRPV